jgi:hypothetical protein
VEDGRCAGVCKYMLQMCLWVLILEDTVDYGQCVRVWGVSGGGGEGVSNMAYFRPWPWNMIKYITCITTRGCGLLLVLHSYLQGKLCFDAGLLSSCSSYYRQYV